jgi:tetratricopeptide (TPR) repeat protein
MEHIGRYDILRELGRGGFGRVYLANDPLIQCQVAIKVITQADDPEMLARFRDEAAVARKLRHASIVTIYDFGEEQGVPYIVMDYLQGMDLQKILEQKMPLSLVEKVRILSEVAAGLQVAHENGIIHRDIKPANIMVLKNGSAKIMDFGIARFNREGATRLTRTGYLPCTLQYTAPEQVLEGFPADAMTDLWAFGVTAFQMFSGKNPFAATEPAQVIYNITSLPLPDLRQLNPETPEDLCEVVRRLLDRDRSKRYQTFEDLRVSLNPVLENLELREADRLVEEAGAMEARGDVQGARRLVSKVLERFPSNTRAQGIRNLIMTRIRLDEAAKQVAELLQKGDRDFSARSYDEALHSYRLADRLNPGSSTVLIRMERAQQMAERARRILEELQQARARLAAGDPREAQRILAGILADDPDNTEAPGIMQAALQEREREDDAARADAILRARDLAAQLQFAQAIEVLATCARKTGNHAGLQQAEQGVRRAEKEAAARARIEGAISKANEHIRKGDYTAASHVLAPMAVSFPDHPDIQERVKFVAQEEARVRREREQRAAVERAAAERAAVARAAAERPGAERAAERAAVTEALPVPPPQPAEPNEARVVEQALKMSREHELYGRLADAVHILEVALSRYPDAAELSNERLRLVTPAPQANQQTDMGKIPVPDTPVPNTLVPDTPARAAPASSSRRLLWVGIGTVGVLLCAALGYRLYPKPPVSHDPPLASLLLPASVTFVYQPGIPSSEKIWNVSRSDLHVVVKGTETWLAASASAGRVVLSLTDAAAGSLAPGDYKETVEVTSNQETAPLDITLKVEKPALAPLRVPDAAPFVYHKGDPPSQQVLKVERSDLHASVAGQKTWLAASVSPGEVVLSLKPGAVASLAPGDYKETVQVTSNRETALVQVSLRVEVPGLPPLQVPDAASFVYRKGDPQSQQVLKVNRPDLRASVMGPKTWLAASASAGQVVLRLDADMAASLAPGDYKGTVQVTANRETALVQVSLRVEAAKEAPKPPAKIVPPLPVKADPCATVAAAGAVVKKPYNGSRHGTANWSGSLPSGACLVLGESSVLEGGGTLTGDEIPPTDVQVETVPRGLEIRALAPTGDQRVVIKNSTPGPLNRIRIDWSIKNP